MPFKHHALALAIVTCPALAQAAERIDEVVVTAARTTAPLTVVTDPKAPRQPLPAHDGADYLKTIPGFSVIRKGGSDGDPTFRGMAGSRLNMLVDGASVLGGCGGRMDPPTAYVFPAAYDRITVIKGPQTVLYGPGNSAGTVLFERDHKRLDKTGAQGHASALGGGFGRNDEVLDATAGTPDAYVRGTATNARQGDYRDGDGDKVHANYHRWSSNAAVGLTPDDDTLVELSGGHSDGEAAYADRTVDGSKFARDSLGLRFKRDNLSETWKKVEANAYYTYIDHVMDNYHLRETNGMAMAMNPDREILGGRVAATLGLSSATEATLGADIQHNQHSARSGSTMDPLEDNDRVDDARFAQAGVFGELSHQLQKHQRLIVGLRADRWSALDERKTVRVGSGMMATYVANPTADEQRVENLGSGFARFEQDLASLPATAYIGLGRAERFPDYWELITKESADSISAFDADPEKTTQLDAGLIYQHGKLSGSVSAFANRIDDYLLIQSGYVKPVGMMGTREATLTRNIDAHSWGGEAELGYAINERWSANASLAYTRGENDSDGTALAQIAPLETRFSLGYDDKIWSFGALLRVVDSQTRDAIDQGNIVGQDLGESSGFAVFSLNAGWRPTKDLLLTTGVDNLFDRTYAEHISRGGEMVAGFSQTERVNEPGRTWWLQAQYDF